MNSVYLFFSVSVFSCGIFGFKHEFIYSYLFRLLARGIVEMIPDSCSVTYSSQFIHKIEPRKYAHKSQLELRHTLFRSISLHLHDIFGIRSDTLSR